MKKNAESAENFDLLFPGIGEIVGGSVREENLNLLEKRIPDKQALAWYLDLRKYGTVPHSGFGLGFERLLLYITGLSNVRDTIPIPRSPKNLLC
jgi:asparaginyl-tRNA synthetase